LLRIKWYMFRYRKMWILFFLAIVFAGILTACSSTNVRSQGGFGVGTRPSLLKSPFESLWEQRTISISMNFSGSGFPFSGSNSARYSGGAFPIRVRATLMDSTLINHGIETFGNLADMSDDEVKNFQERYYENHPVNEYVFVWAEISTRYHESYLDMDRWIFYLEDEEGQQFEPSRVVEVDTRQESSPATTMQPNIGMNPSLQFSRLMENNPAKIVEFYFPKTSFYGEKLLGGDNKKLILGAVNREDMDERAGGTWDLTALHY